MVRPNEWAGKVGGLLLSPLTGVISAARKARMFHPQGLIFSAQVTAESASEPTSGAGGPGEDNSVVGHRLAGRACVRFSTALWKGGREWLDALGVAVRFCADPTAPMPPKPDDQDLLFATIRSPWTTALAPFTTQVRSFLENDYYAVSPFWVPPLGRVKWRLVCPRGIESLASSRDDKLREAVRSGQATLLLQQRPLLFRKPWSTVARIELQQELQLDEAALRFSPFQTGRGIHPRGFVHALRRWTYASSQAARPAFTKGASARSARKQDPVSPNAAAR